MLTCETTIITDRPSRYLIQLCRHAAAMGASGGGHHPRTHTARAALADRNLKVTAHHSETDGVVTIAPWGRCTLRATAGTLTLRVDAADHDTLGRIQEIVTRDLERFGRRDMMTVNWPVPRASDAELDLATEAGGNASSTLRRGRRAPILIALVAVAAVAAHLGLGGVIAANAGWTGASLGIVLLVVAGKILLVVLGRRALHRPHRP